MLLTRHHAAPVVNLFFSLTHVTFMTLQHKVFIRYSTSVTYETLCHSSGHLVIYRECYRFERTFFYSQTYFTLHPFLLSQSLPEAGSSTSKLAELHADLRNIAPVRLCAWITTIHKWFICGRFCLTVRAGMVSQGTLIFTEN